VKPLKRLKVTRTIEIEGEPDWVEDTLERSVVSIGRREFTVAPGSIREIKVSMEELEDA
jgi:hypothetical protein